MWQEVLEDPKYKDAPLTSDGQQQVQESRESFEKFLNQTPYPEPTLVLVSPWMRTLQTAITMFQNHKNITACEIVRERRTVMSANLSGR